MNTLKSQRITFFDVETPNGKGDSICSIGLISCVNGIEVDRRYYLVDPEAPFWAMNIRIHGIRPVQVMDAPTFPQIWQEIEPWFTQGILVAHNAAFDMNVIKKCLLRYGLDVPPMLSICTVHLSRKHVNLDHYRLNDVCTYLQIPLEHHHHAMDDTIGCKGIFDYWASNGRIDERDITVYSMDKTMKYRAYVKKNGSINLR